jgi:transcriptional regulator with PAS, ATPase and Fis domain
MSLIFQGKLLRVLQNKVVRPLGSDTDRSVDFRLLAASNQDLDKMVEKGTFRRDLLYRLRVLSIELPPLRERTGDVDLLACYFVGRYSGECADGDGTVPELSEDVLARLRAAPWPGNVRELENVILRALVASRGGPIEVSHLGLPEDGGVADQDLGYEAAKQNAIRRFQSQYVETALRHAEGNISHAATRCGMTRAALQRIMRSLDIDRTRFLSK